MKKKSDEEITDVVFDEETEGRQPDCEKKLQKLKKELATCKEERQEYLDGWQRLRADVANNKAAEAQAKIDAQTRAREAVVEDILPTLDSFDSAFRGEAWDQVDEAWRTGVEYIHTQLREALERNGAQAFGSVGEQFDPHLHEAAKEIDGGTSGVIADVLQTGYRVGERVVRPARVVVYR